MFGGQPPQRYEDEKQQAELRDEPDLRLRQDVVMRKGMERSRI